MKEFDFEQLVKRTVKQLKEELKQYKQQLTNEFKTTDKPQPVELYQVRKLLTSPSEYVLVCYIEDTGLIHAVPLTEYVNLTTSNLRLHVANHTFAPLPYYVYLNKEALEKISLPIAVVKPETVKKIIEDVETTPIISNMEPVKEFMRLVWKRYEQLTIASLLYNTFKQEGLDN
jgi:hypothetical protein